MMEIDWTMSGNFRVFCGSLLLIASLNMLAETAKHDALREKAAAGDAESAFYLGNEYSRYACLTASITSLQRH